MWITDIDVVDKEHSVEGFDEEYNLFPVIRAVLRYATGVDEQADMLPAVAQSQRSLAHRFSVKV